MSFECERRNALEVVALGPEDPEATGFTRLQKILKSTRTRYVRGSCYHLDPEKLGFFDIVLFCGVLYHLRYPLLAIDNIRRVATDKVYVETVVMDERPVEYEETEGLERAKSAHALLSGLKKIPVWIFFSGKELEGDFSNWFGPNETAVEQAFQSAGFDIVRCSGHAKRGQFKATVRPGIPEFISDGSAEAYFYPQLLAPLIGGHPLRRRIDELLDELIPFPLEGLAARVRTGIRYRLTGTLLQEDFLSPRWRRKVRLRGATPLPPQSD
jgi:tRNA (mo5U34)-methyltransferase